MITYWVIVMHLFFSSYCFAQGRPGAIYMSKDNGETWVRSDNGLPPDAIVNEFAEKKDLVIAATENYGIYISKDQLQTWHSSNKGLPAKKVDVLHIFQGRIFAGTYQRGVFLSDNDGSTWHAFNEGLTNLTIRSFFTFGNMLLAGTNSGIFALAGDKWKQIYSGFQINDFIQAGNTLFAATNRGVVFSPASLSEWRLILKDTAIHTFSEMGEGIAGFTYNSEMISIDANRTTKADIYYGIPKPAIYSMIQMEGYILALMQTGLFKSFDQGKTWEKIGGYGIENINIKAIRKIELGLIAGVGKDGC